jgi:rhamnose utilization protein RhaD (predicted bifunctional aldolase and dehydrogenase)
MKHEINELVEISKAIGEMPDLIQGGGGNTSVKLDDKIMAIKASGIFLKDMSLQNGISFVNYKLIRDFIEKSGPESMDDYIKQQTLQYDNILLQRPSIETGFHAVLEKYTVHSHSVYANILTCAKNAETLVKDIFPDSSWIQYKTPGTPLTLEIETARRKSKHSLYFIQNHGAITTAEQKENAVDLHLRIRTRIQKKFALPDFARFKPKYQSLEFMRSNVLFPDQVVYTINDDVIQTAAAQETIKAYFYILETLKTNQLTPNFMPHSEVQTIESLESEKYRKGLLKL